MAISKVRLTFNIASIVILTIVAIITYPSNIANGFIFFAGLAFFFTIDKLVKKEKKTRYAIAFFILAFVIVLFISLK